MKMKKLPPSPNCVHQQSANRTRSIPPLHLVGRVGVFLILAGLLAGGSYFASSASAPKATPNKVSAATISAKKTSGELARQNAAHSPALMFLAPLFQAQGINVFAANCTTLNSAFNLGQTVCAQVSGVVPGSGRLFWGDPTFHVVRVTPITSDPQDDSFAPATVGTWTLLVVSNDGMVRARANFVVKDPANPSAEISVASSPRSPKVAAGGQVTFVLQISNSGPDTAANARLSVPVPDNATFVSFTQNSGPGFICQPNNGTTICDISGLPADTNAEFSATYNINAGAQVDSDITLTITGSSTTTDPKPVNDTASSDVTVGPGAACSINAASDITVNNDISGGEAQGGAVVTFDTPGTTGSCNQVTCSTPSGSFFPIGQTAVVCSSNDSTNVSRFNVTVNDTSAPTITCPANVSVAESSAGSGSAEVAFPAPTVVDNDPNVHVTFSPASGSTFTVAGSPHTVTATATDFSGASASCTFTVTVTSSQCSLACPQNITVNESPAGSGSAVVNFADPGESGTCGTVSYDHASGSSFNLGTTTVTATSSTSSSTCSFTVTVTANADTEAPVISCPANIVQPAATGTCSASVNPGMATATDNNPGVTVAGVRSDAQPLNAPYSVGEVIITWTAKDAAGNTAECEQSIQITENVPPSVTAPAPVTVVVNSACDQVEVPNFSAALVTSDNCTQRANLEITQDPAAETLVGVGSYPVTIKVTDSSGNFTTVTTTFTVVDNIPPVITSCASNVTVNTDAGACSATGVNLGSPVATDNCGTTTATNDAPATFPLGATTVHWTVSDGHGNTASCNQVVTVEDHEKPVITLSGASPMTVECHTTFTDPGATAHDACGGDFAATASGTVNPNAVGTYTLTYNATDPSGNAAIPVTRTVTVVDTTPPTISCPGNITVYLPLNSSATSMVVSYSAPTATDTCGGTTTTQTGGLASGASFPVGTTINAFRVTDDAGNHTDCSFSVTVLYDFTGFFSPVGNIPVLNAVNAGRAVPVKFSLSGNKGLNIFAVDSPYSVGLNCNTSDPGVDVIETLTAGGSSLSYSPDQYNYVWKTENSWAGTCRQLVVTLNDGSVHVANFKFR